ncbi:MAG: hypothetical protein EPN88_13880 [Bacteroidetes bacterium]|nr:MAG: hypothetical protein EPN88_13880 [Bacteroidota bacterium]
MENINIILKGMTRKQKRAITLYTTNGYNGTEAFIEAGYSRRSATKIACAMLQKPSVLKYLEYIEKENAERNKVTRDYFVVKLKEIIEDKKSKANEKIGGLALLAKVTGHIKEAPADTRNTVILNQIGLNDDNNDKEVIEIDT